MTQDPGAPRITLVMPSVDSFEPPVAMVRATGARVEGAHRFVIDGPMTVEQVGHLLQLKEARFRYGHSEVHFDIWVDPEIPGAHRRRIG